MTSVNLHPTQTKFIKIVTLVFVLTDIEMSTFNRRNEEQRNDQLKGECGNRSTVTNSSKEDLVKDTLGPPSPNQHKQPLGHMNSNNTSVYPHSIEVSGNQERSINTQASLPKPPRIRPRLSLMPRKRSRELLDRGQPSSKFFSLYCPLMHEHKQYL